MAKFVLLALLAFGAAELFVLVKTGLWFGAWFPVLGVFLGLAAGGLVIRHAGLKSIERLKVAMRSGTSPGGAPGAGLAGVIAGFLFILPGFLSDGMALLLLLPWTRALLVGAILRRSTIVTARSGVHSGPIIEAEAIEIHGSDRRDGGPSPWKP